MCSSISFGVSDPVTNSNYSCPRDITNGSPSSPIDRDNFYPCGGENNATGFKWDGYNLFLQETYQCGE